MKIRNDFVTNSSSANYTIVFQLKSDQDEMVEYALSTSDFGGHYDGSEPYGALFEAGWPVKELELETPYERGGEIIVGSETTLMKGYLDDPEATARVTVNPEAMHHWAMQCARHAVLFFSGTLAR